MVYMTCLHTQMLDNPCSCINRSCCQNNKGTVWWLMQRKPNQLQLPHDLPTYLGLTTFTDWADYHCLELCLSAWENRHWCQEGRSQSFSSSCHFYRGLFGTTTVTGSLQLQRKNEEASDTWHGRPIRVCRHVCWRCSQVCLLLQSRRARIPSAALCHSELVACPSGLPRCFSPLQQAHGRCTGFC